MPHQCVRCNTFYEDGAQEILKGCKCGSKLFFFVRKEALQKAKEINIQLTSEEKKKIEDDVLELVGEERETLEQPVILDFESIRCSKPGKFEIDLVKIFKDDPLIYKLGEGKYIIDLPTVFKKETDQFVKKRK